MKTVLTTRVRVRRRFSVCPTLALVATAVGSALVGGCHAPPRAEAPVPASTTVASLLAGSYSSAAQARADPEFFEVHLHMAPIWTARTDGHWLYVEQAMATALDAPYRQRIYCVTDAGDGTVWSVVYELPNAADRIGAWRTPALFDADSAESLTKRDGCALRLAREGAMWTGTTHGKDCLSSLRGAAYATSEVRLLSDRIETWDRGFDSNDTQVWGAKKGPYLFVKEACARNAK